MILFLISYLYDLFRQMHQLLSNHRMFPFLPACNSEIIYKDTDLKYDNMLNVIKLLNTNKTEWHDVVSVEILQSSC